MHSKEHTYEADFNLKYFSLFVSSFSGLPVFILISTHLREIDSTRKL